MAWRNRCSRSAAIWERALGPLLAAFIVVPFGQPSIAWFSVVALLAMVILSAVGRWYRAKLADLRARPRGAEKGSSVPRKRVVVSIAILMLLIFSKDFYVASFTNYFTFYLISKFQVSVQDAQIYLFVFLGALAVGTRSRRARGRQDRAPLRDLDLDPRRPALHPRAAVTPTCSGPWC